MTEILATFQVAYSAVSILLHRAEPLCFVLVGLRPTKQPTIATSPTNRETKDWITTTISYFEDGSAGDLPPRSPVLSVTQDTLPPRPTSHCELCTTTVIAQSESCRRRFRSQSSRKTRGTGFDFVGRAVIAVRHAVLQERWADFAAKIHPRRFSRTVPAASGGIARVHKAANNKVL